MEEEDLEAREKQLRTARLMLWAALIGGLIMIFAMVTNRAGVFITFMLLSWLGGLSGVRDVARAIGTHPLLMYPVLVVACVPFLNLLPIVYYLIRSHGALEPGEAPEDPVSAALPLRKAAPGRASPQPRAATGIRAAIACVKSADLGSGGASASGDEKLTVGIPSVPDMPAEDLPVMRAIQGVFLVGYMIDEGSHYTYVNEGQLKASGMTRDELHELGMANLAALVDDKPGLSLHPQEGFHGLVMGGQFEASLMLVDALWDRALAKHFPNGPVVAIPSRDVCAFCDSQSAKGIAQLRKVVARVTAGGSRLMSDKLFIRRDGAWRKLAR